MDATPLERERVVPDSELIDPANSERKIYREPNTGSQREIWRPGDGEGDQSTDYVDRRGPPLPLESKWRLFQSDIGPISIKNQPPRFIILDDRAAFELLKSNIPKARLSANWPHDFGGPGKIRARRPHRGRPAIKNPNALGNEKFQSTVSGKNDVYYFIGEKDFEPIHYRYVPPAPEEPPKRKRKPEKGDWDYNPRAHGHNQYTPKDMLVKHGAPSFSTKQQAPLPKVPRINTFLRKDIQPRYAQDRTLFGGSGDSAQYDQDMATMAAGHEFRADRARSKELREGSTTSRSRVGNVNNSDTVDAAQNDSESDEEMFPLSKRARKETTEEVLADVDVPRSMGYVERQDYEQKLAARMLGSLQADEDVQRMSTELSQVIVKNRQQAHEIQQLKQTLAESQNADWQVEAETAQARAKKLEAKVLAQEQEIETLKQTIKYNIGEGLGEEEDPEDDMV